MSRKKYTEHDFHDLGYGDGYENHDNYGYENDYGYENPDYGYKNSTNSNNNYEAADYGYGKANPDLKLQHNDEMGNSKHLGYGYVEPCAALSASSERQAPRRSSLRNKGTPRRNSIGYKGEMTLVLPTGEARKKRTSISFVDDTQNQTKEVKPVYEMIKDTDRLWFKEEEYQNIKAEISRIMKQSKSNKQDDFRGLENYKNSDVEDIRREASAQVIEEYSLQKARGTYDGETIRQMYSFHTLDSEVEAAERGQKDERSIQNYMKDTRSKFRRMSC